MKPSVRHPARVLAVATALTALTLAAPTVSSAASIPTRVVLYTGDGNTKPVGPPGPLAYQWTIQAAPEKITITNTKLQVVGTITEIPKAKQIASGCLPPQCSEWWYDITSPGTKDATPQVVMPQFYWNQPGKATVAPPDGIEGNPNTWFVASDGAWSPRCLQWAYAGVAYYIVLSKADDWQMTNETACLTA